MPDVPGGFEEDYLPLVDEDVAASAWELYPDESKEAEERLAAI